MSSVISRNLFTLALVCFGLWTAHAHAQEGPQEARVEDVASAANEAANDTAPQIEVRTERRGWHRHDSGVVAIGHDAKLGAGDHAGAVVSILGSSTSEGSVEDAVVSIMGNTRVTGPVGDAAVAVMGNVYVNSKIGGDAVAVMGNVELGPQAEVAGNVVVVGGTLIRDPAALVYGTVDRVSTGQMPQFGWLQGWIKKCLLYGRPLAFDSQLGWAWGVALGFLAFYVLLALMFRSSVDRCVQTLETQPGRSTVAALLALVLTPVVFIVLCITVIGIALVPFLWLGLICAGLFGKAVILAALGRRITRFFDGGPLAHTAMAVLIGGALVLLLYVIPVVGFIVYKLLGILGLGVVIYTLLLAGKAAKRERAQAAPPPVAPAPIPASPEVAATEAEDKKKIANEPPSALDLERAGFWIRMAALAIDAILIGVLLALVDEFEGFWLLLLATYGAVMWKLRGTTIGGIVFDLQVVRLDGRPIDWATSIVRALSCFLSLVVAGLGFFWIAFDERKQAWHDKIAGTVVVRVPKGVSLV